MDTLAVFRSRSEALKVYKNLLNAKIACSSVATPSYLRMGCGLSVVFNGVYQETVKSIINAVGASSFAGFYRR